MKNSAMLLVAVLGTSVMVNATPTPVKATPAKEVKAPKHPKAHKKAKVEKKATAKTEAMKTKK